MSAPPASMSPMALPVIPGTAASAASTSDSSPAPGSERTSTSTSSTSTAPIGTPIAPPTMMVPAVATAPLAPARTSPGVGVAVAGGFTSTLASTIQYSGPWNWPLQKPTDIEALNVAGFIITVVAVLFHLWANQKSKPPIPPTDSVSTSTITTSSTPV